MAQKLCAHLVVLLLKYYILMYLSEDYPLGGILYVLEVQHRLSSLQIVTIAFIQYRYMYLHQPHGKLVGCAPAL